MKIVSRIVLVLGIIAVVVALGAMIWATMDIWGNMQAKYGHESMNPYPMLWAGFGVGVVGSFLAGLGLGVKPKHLPEPKQPAA